MKQKEKADIIISNGAVLTVNNNDEIINNGAVVIKKNIIIDLGKSFDIKNKYKTEKEIDAKSGVIMPGIVNAHTHLAMSIFRGLADNLPLDKWLMEHVFPEEKRFIDKEF